MSAIYTYYMIISPDDSPMSAHTVLVALVRYQLIMIFSSFIDSNLRSTRSLYDAVSVCCRGGC
jgi:hypothetical protein